MSILNYWGEWVVNESVTRRRVLDCNIRWHQNSPFNDLCPLMNNEDRASAGCVAIATMQILAHHKTPTCSQLYFYGNNPVTNVRWDDLIASDLLPTIKNSNDVFGARYSAADVSLHIGKGCSMYYNIDGEGSSFALPLAAKNYFARHGYKAAMDMYYNKTEITKEVQAGRPVFIGAAGNLEYAHAWVIDGYMERNADLIKVKKDGSQSIAGKRHQKLYHCNWGWAGRCDGYYVVPSVHENIEFDLSWGPDYTEDGDQGGRSSTYFSWLFHTVTARPK